MPFSLRIFMPLLASDLNPKELPCGVYYTEGDDAYWQKKTEEAFSSLLPADSFSLFVFDKLTSVADIFSAVTTIGFCNEDPVVIVRDYEYVATAQDHAELEKLFAQEAYVLFSGVKFLNDKEKKRFKAIGCAKMDKYACVRYATNLLENADRDAVARLVDLCECDMSRINQEAQKLIDYTDGAKITLADVNEVVVEDTEAQFFSFVSDLTAGRKDRAKKTLDKLLKKGDAPSYMLSVLIGQYRRMLHVGLSKKSDAELAAVMKVKEYAIKKSRSDRPGGTRQIKNVVNMLVSYEYAFKRGQMSERSAFDAAIDRLMGGAV